jgi:hypothetical protein
MDDWSRIERKIDAMSEAVTELRSMWPHLCRRLDHLENEVYGGNGKIGLTNRVQTMYLLGIWLAGIAGTVAGGIVMWAILGKVI